MIGSEVNVWYFERLPWVRSQAIESSMVRQRQCSFLGKFAIFGCLEAAIRDKRAEVDWRRWIIRTRFPKSNLKAKVYPRVYLGRNLNTRK
jgi:hypothetical protein